MTSGCRMNDEAADPDSDRRLAMQSVSDRLCELAANILRSVRGAGKPYQIGRQAQSLTDAMVTYRDAVGHFPSDEELAAALDMDIPEERLDQMSDEQQAIVRARQQIIRGALQVAASRLVDQRPQEAAGMTDIDMGIRDLEKAREDRRARAAAQPRSPQSSHRRKP
jgi:hypothetical protein